MEFDKKNFKYLLLVICTTEKLIENADHIFSKNHSKDCTELKMLLPFTFAVDLVSKRKVEVRNGKIIVYCPLWSKILEVIFKYFLNLEMKLLMKCKVLKEVIYNLEDDRIRQIIKRFTNMLKGTMSKEIKVPVHRGSINVLSQLFPPCMANLHQILRRTHRLSYESRYAKFEFSILILNHFSEMLNFQEKKNY